MSPNAQLPRDWELGVEDRPLEDVRFLRQTYAAVAEAFRRQQRARGGTSYTEEQLYMSARRGGFDLDRDDFSTALDIMAETALPVVRNGEGYMPTAGYTSGDWQEILEDEAE